MSVERLESNYVQVAPLVELHYVEKGAGQPILFIPGLTFSSEIFESQIDYFSKTNRVIAIDPRGQGTSTKTVHGNDYATHGKDLAKLIEILDLKDLILVGWSTGNLEVWSYISQFGKKRVKAVVTIDMSPVPLSIDPSCWVEGSLDELRTAASEILISPKGVRDFFSEYITAVMIQRNVEEEELEYLLDISAKTPYYICSSLFCNAVLSNYFEVAKEISETLPSIMFIAEHWSDIAETFMNENFPGTETYIMGGHLMFYEYPEKWNKKLEDFIENIK